MRSLRHRGGADARGFRVLSRSTARERPAAWSSYYSMKCIDASFDRG